MQGPQDWKEPASPRLQMKATMAGAPEVIGKLMADKARNLSAWDLAGDSESPGLPVYMAVAVSAWQGRGPED